MQDYLQNLGATRGRLALAAGLFIVLLVVTYLEFAGPRESPGRRPPPRRVAVSQVDSATAPAQSEADHDQRREAWAVLLRRTAQLHPESAHDPFAAVQPLQAAESLQSPSDHPDGQPSSETPLQPVTDANLVALQAEMDRGLIIIIGEVPIVTVGTRTLRIGDKIGRFRIVNIDETGLFLVDQEEEGKQHP